MDPVKQWMDDFGLTDRDDFEPEGLHYDLIDEEFAEFRHEAICRGDRANVIKEAGDLIWVTMYYLWKMGVDPMEVLRRLYQSNRTKLDDMGKPIFNEDGKVMKGPNYVPAKVDDL